jgi:type IV pilus assembly protein PilQ
MWYSKNQKSNLTAAIVVCLFAIFVMAALVVAQVQPARQTTLIAQGPGPASDDVQALPQDEDDEQMQIVDNDLGNGAIQSISFKKDMTIRDALRFLALKYQKNIVPSEKVEGGITVTNLYNVTFEEALQAILGTNKYEIQGNFIRVFTLEEFQQDKTRFDHAVITLYYISAAEAQKLVTPLLSEAGQIASTTAAALDTEAGKGGDTVSVRDQLVVSDYPERVAAVKELIDSIDVRPPQILIEVTVLEATLTEQTEFGIDFNTMDGVAVDKVNTDGIMTDALAGAVTGVTGLTVGITNDHVKVFIRALETITDATVLANPKILALNKQAGKLLIGNEDGYYSSQTLSEGGNFTQQINFLETGTKLEFRPFICKDGYIRMEIFPEQSSGEVVSGVPSKTTTTVKTNIMVEDGKTIVIGGLFQEKTTLSRSQVPLLGDIPIVGELFKKSDDESIRTELIVLITPHIVHDPDQANGADRLEDVKRLAYDARSNITWMSRTKVAEDRYKKAVQLYTDGQLDAALSQLTGFNDMERSFLDVERLKERIINESQPPAEDQIERIMLDTIEKQESGRWLRR